MLWDTHMHCAFSGDSDADPELMIQSAIEKQLDGICFTDHLDYDYPEEPELFLLDFPAYQERIFSLKEKYKKNLRSVGHRARTSAASGKKALRCDGRISF